MGDSKGSLEKAADKATGEIVFAAGTVAGGCDPAEAIANMGEGVREVIFEYVDFNAKHLGDRANSPEMISRRLDATSPNRRFRASFAGKLLIPAASDIIPMVVPAKEKPDLGSSDKEVRKQRGQLAGAGPTLVKLLKPAEDVQSALKYPGSSIPYIAQAISPDQLWWAAMPTLITLGVVGFLNRRFKMK